MLLSRVIGGILFLAYASGQKQFKSICNIDPDVMYFENNELEKLRKLFVFGGECSPALWKKELGNPVNSLIRKERDVEVNDGDQARLTDLTGYQETSGAFKVPLEFDNPSRFQFKRPHATNIPNPGSQLSSQNLPPSSDFLEFEKDILVDTQTKTDQDNFVSESQRKRQIPGPNFFGFGGQGSSQFSMRPEDFFFPNIQRRPQKQLNLFSPNIQGRTQNQRRLDAPDDKDQSSKNQIDFFPSSNERRQQVRKRPDNFLRPFSERLQLGGRKNNVISPASQSQRRPQIQTPPSSFRSRRPQIQTPPSSFGSRRPQNPPDRVPSESQRRPQFQRPSDQFIGRPDNFIMPDNERFVDNQRQATNTVETAEKTTSTTSRPESTTLPGPPTWATEPSLCVQRCATTPEYNPVCGTDGVTYRNPGKLRCEQGCGKANVDVNHYGNCRFLTSGTPLRKIIGKK